MDRAAKSHELSEKLEVHVGRDYREDVRRQGSHRSAKRLRVE